MSRTLLIGLDGATFSILEPLMDDGIMPYLKGIVGGGVRATLMSTPNPLTPPSWTSLMTGRSPGHHGIFDFIRAEDRNGEMYFTLYNARDVRCETIWSIASRQGRRVSVFNFPVMFPPRPLNGYLVPGFVSWRHLRRAVYPASLYERMKGMPDFRLRELGWDLELERKAVQSLATEEYEDWIRFHISREQQWFRIARDILENEPCDLLAVLFDGVDKLEHLCWRLLDPALVPLTPTPWETRVRNLCLDYFRQLDDLLRQLIEAAGSDTRVFMVSDHGFGPTDRIFRVNVWLHERGLLTWRESASASPDVVERRMKSDFALLDWQRTIAYARTSASNGIYIRVKQHPEDHGVSAAEYEAFRKQLMDDLLAYRDPMTGDKIVRKILTREEAFPGDQMYQAPDLTLALIDGGFVSIINAQPIVQMRSEIAGTHRPEGVFIGTGPGIPKGGTIPALSIMDLAAILLHSVDLDVPCDLEGRVPPSVFSPEFLQAQPVRYGEATLPPEPDRRVVSDLSDAEAEGQVLDRLRSLGYLE